MRKLRTINLTTVIAIAIVVAAVGFVLGNRQKPANGEQPVAGSKTDDMSSHHGSQPKGSYSDLQALVGKPAPDFSLADKAGARYSLAELKGKNIILFFNEGLMCYPSCWNQIVSLSQDKRFSREDTVVLSVVVDQPDQWQRAINKMPALGQATVLFDTGGAVSSAYGMMKTESSMHYGQYPGHSYLIIDKEGVVRHALDDPRMGIHNEEIVAQLNQLGV